MSVCHLSNWGESVLNIKTGTSATRDMNQEPRSTSSAMPRVEQEETKAGWRTWCLPDVCQLSRDSAPSARRLHQCDREQQVQNVTILTFVTEHRLDPPPRAITGWSSYRVMTTHTVYNCLLLPSVSTTCPSTSVWTKFLQRPSHSIKYYIYILFCSRRVHNVSPRCHFPRL